MRSGFFSLGTLAGELENPRSTFTISIAILFPAVLILNTLPLAVALGLDDRLDHYSAGYFNVRGPAITTHHHSSPLDHYS